MISHFLVLFDKKVALAAGESLKNIFGHHERDQGVLRTTPQITWFELKSFSIVCFPIES